MKNEPVFQLRLTKRLYDKYKQKYRDDPNFTEEEVRKAVYHQFRFVRKTMKEGNFQSVRLKYFGLFHAKPERVKKLEES